MATGIVGHAALAAATETTIYTVGAGVTSKATIRLCNRTTGPISIRLGVVDTGSVGDDDRIEYDYRLPGKLSRTIGPINMQVGAKVSAYASAAGITVLVDAEETAIPS